MQCEICELPRVRDGRGWGRGPGAIQVGRSTSIFSQSTKWMMKSIPSETKTDRDGDGDVDRTTKSLAGRDETAGDVTETLTAMTGGSGATRRNESRAERRTRRDGRLDGNGG